MKNNINTLVVCSTEELKRLKEDVSKISTEVIIKYSTDNYKDALNIINDINNTIDAIIIDGTLPGEDILSLLTKYSNKYYLSRTIIIDNIKLDCYNLTTSDYQLFNHQYMTNIAAPCSEAYSSFISYEENNLLSLHTQDILLKYT